MKTFLRQILRPVHISNYRTAVGRGRLCLRRRLLHSTLSICLIIHKRHHIGSLPVAWSGADLGLCVTVPPPVLGGGRFSKTSLCFVRAVPG